MIYDSYRYLWPARPERALAPEHLSELKGYWAQAKLNGTNTTLYIPPDGKVFARGRHGDEALKTWSPGEQLQAFVEQLPRGDWYVIQAELLHSKGIGVKDTLYLHDILVDFGDYLVGETYRQRYRRLAELCNLVPDYRTYEPWRVAMPGIWLANNHGDLRAAFERWRDDPRIEGIVAKNPEAKLMPCGRPTANARWQVKSRYPKANLAF
jgi:hypothetical protein